MFDEIRRLLSEIISSESFTLDISSVPGRGHFATNAAFVHADGRGIKPPEAAEELKNKLEKRAPELFSKIEVAGGGFLNVWISESILAKELSAILKSGKNWGSKKGNGKVAVIDYSHPNIAKPMSVAHLRSTIIGQALYNILEFSGWKTIGDNHLGDWGKQFGVLIAAYKEQEENGKTLSSLTIDDLLSLYVDYSSRMAEDESLNERAREETRLLQEGDEKNNEIWQAFYDISMREFEKVYKTLGVSFDHYLGESFYADTLPEIVSSALKSRIAKKSEGAVVVPLDEEGLPPYVIQKSDGAYLYSTTDIAAVIYRVREFKPNLILYVVDNGQSLHFSQLFAVVRKMKIVKDEDLVHAKFGLVLSGDMKKLSTRAGRHVSLTEVIDEAVSRAREVVLKKQPDMPKHEQDKVARTVGIGALKYNDLSQNRTSDITFDWDKMLSIEGNSGPYIQYTYTRISSILKKAGEFTAKNANLSALNSESEINLIVKLSAFPHAVERAVAGYAPHHIAEYTYELAKEMNGYYEKEPILKAEGDLREARLALVSAVADIIKTGLDLLGIGVIDRM